MSTTPETFAPFDTADYLDDIDAAAAYLEAALEEAGDDPAFVAQALGTIARSGNVSALARRTGMSRQGLYTWVVGSAQLPSSGVRSVEETGTVHRCCRVA